MVLQIYKLTTDSDKILVLGPQMVHQTRTDWSIDHQSQYKFDIDFQFRLYEISQCNLWQEDCMESVHRNDFRTFVRIGFLPFVCI
jgi:hypothetical protein